MGAGREKPGETTECHSSVQPIISGSAVRQGQWLGAQQPGEAVH